MKTLKSYLAGFAALLAAFSFSACQDDIDAPGVDVPKANVEPNMTILELKEMFWDDATNYARVIEDKENPDHRFVIHGRVCSSDEAGNVFKSLIIQDETAAIAFSIDTYNLYLEYRVGQDVVLDVTGMEIGKYAGLQQIGRKSWYENGNTDQVSFMSLQYFQRYAQLEGLPQRQLVDTLVLSSFAPITQQTPEVLRKYQSRLVRFNNVSFPEGGKRTFSVYHTSVNEDQNATLVDAAGSSLIVRTSGYCTFFNDLLPVGNIDLVGILSYYNNAWQIIMIDGDGVIEVGERPGTQEKPYTVSEAIALEADGIETDGWVKGYIVGTVAPETESVTSNDGITFTPPFVLANSLVIAADATETDYTKCMVVMLPQGSVFQTVGNLRDNPSNLGREIMVKGDLRKVLDTYGIDNNGGTAADFAIDGVEVPSDEVADGTGTEENPYNVARTLDIITSGQMTDAEVYVKGTIASIKEIDTGSYGNASFYISDVEGGQQFYIFRSYWLNKAKFTSTDQLAVGAEVVMCGKLINYMDNTPEMAQGGYVYTYNGSSEDPGTGDTPGTGDEPGTGDDPEPGIPSEDGVTISSSQLTGDENSAEAATTIDGYTITIAKGSGATAPKIWGTGEARMYANNTITIAGPAPIAKIVFEVPASMTNMKNRYTELHPNTGAMSPAQAQGDTSATWAGNANSVTFTVDALGKLGAENTKPGQFFFKSITIYPAE